MFQDGGEMFQDVDEIWPSSRIKSRKLTVFKCNKFQVLGLRANIRL